MAEKKTSKKMTKKQQEDLKHDISLTLMTGILVVLASVSAIAVACLYYLNNL